MDKKKIIEYVIIAIVVILVVYMLISWMSYQYEEDEITVGSITLLAPTSSEYEEVGDTIEFKNRYDIYDLNVRKTTSSDKDVERLVSYGLFFQAAINNYNESCYLIGVYYDNGDGFTDHFMIVPFDAFDRNTFSFTKDCDVWLFDGKDPGFVEDSALMAVIK